MTNKEQYLFSDFTLDNYRRLIRLAKKQGFHFIRHKDAFVEDRKDVIWRHDVEFSPTIALCMAEIEKEEGVQTTYFWQLHSDYYNTASTFFMEVFYKIYSLGHHMGLHFDSHFWNIQKKDDLDYYVRLDAEYLKAVIKAMDMNINIDTFSFHNTNPFIMKCNEYSYGGLINVYSSFFKDRYDYCADSTGIWRFDRLEDCLLNPDVQHLHALTHDGMWSKTEMSPHSRIMNCIQREADRKKINYVNNLPKTGNINVGKNTINPGIDEE